MRDISQEEMDVKVAKDTATSPPGEKPIPGDVVDAKVDEQQVAQELASEEAAVVKELFQQGFKVIFKDGAFDTLMEQVQEEGDIVQPTSLLLTSIISDMVQTGGITDLNLLFTVGMMLMQEVVTSLNEVGVDVQDGQPQEIVAKTVQGTLSNNPEMGEAVMKNPQMQQMLKDSGMSPPNSPNRGVMDNTEQPAGLVQ